MRCDTGHPSACETALCAAASLCAFLRKQKATQRHAGEWKAERGPLLPNPNMDPYTHTPLSSHLSSKKKKSKGQPLLLSIGELEGQITPIKNWNGLLFACDLPRPALYQVIRMQGRAREWAGTVSAPLHRLIERRGARGEWTMPAGEKGMGREKRERAEVSKSVACARPPTPPRRTEQESSGQMATKSFRRTSSATFLQPSPCLNCSYISPTVKAWGG